MSDGQSHGERLESTARRATAPDGLADETMRWRVPADLSALRPFQPIFQPVSHEGCQAEAARREQRHREAVAEARAAIVAEKQSQREHELAMAEVENEAALVEARVRLAAAWHPDSVAAFVGAALAAGVGLGAAFAWAVLR